MSRSERRALVEREAPALPVSRQCRLLAVSRASVYRRRAEISEEDCTIMALIDRQYLARPYYCGFRRCRSVIPRSCRSLFRHDVARLRRPAGGLFLARSELLVNPLWLISVGSGASCRR